MIRMCKTTPPPFFKILLKANRRIHHFVKKNQNFSKKSIFYLKFSQKLSNGASTIFLNCFV